MIDYYILGDDPSKPVKVPFMVWARWFEENFRNRVVKKTTFPWGTHISTVFLGLDHSFGLEDGDGPVPVLWESMIFAWHDGDEAGMDRYTSYEDALKGHERLVWEALRNDIRNLPLALWVRLSQGSAKAQTKLKRLWIDMMARKIRVQELEKAVSSKSPSSSRTEDTK